MNEKRYWLMDIRLSKRLTRKECAEMCEISPTYWSTIENNASRTPSLRKAVQIANKLDFDYHLFFKDVLENHG